jgi:hypothetical protein
LRLPRHRRSLKGERKQAHMKKPHCAACAPSCSGFQTRSPLYRGHPKHRPFAAIAQGPQATGLRRAARPRLGRLRSGHLWIFECFYAACQTRGRLPANQLRVCPGEYEPVRRPLALACMYRAWQYAHSMRCPLRLPGNEGFNLGGVPNCDGLAQLKWLWKPPFADPPPDSGRTDGQLACLRGSACKFADPNNSL